MEASHFAIGRRIKRLRENKGLSRQQIATRLAVDQTAVAAWEAGKYLPRAARRVRLAALLGIDPGSLFAEKQDSVPLAGSAALVDTLDELPGLLRDLLKRAEHNLKAFRLASPYSTPAHVQEEFRSHVDTRLRTGSIEIQRIEIFYELGRLKEVLSNIIRYDGRPYAVKSYCAGVKEVVPGMGGYMIDDREILVGAYWTAVPPPRRTGLRLSGEPFRTYFAGYWHESWRRGTLLNPNGARDLSAVREVALRLGLEPSQWRQFVDEAHSLKMDDGLPPLI